MKKSFYLLFLMFVNSVVTHAQDVISFTNGTKVTANVLKVTPRYIEYSYPDETTVYQIPRKTVLSVLYKSQRFEQYNFPKKEYDKSKNPLNKKTMFYTKLGVSFNQMIPEEGLTRHEDHSSQVGEAFDFGFSWYLKNRFYWAPEIGIVTKGHRTSWTATAGVYHSAVIEAYKYKLYHGVYFQPINFGYRFELPKNFSLDPHLGIYGCYYFAGVSKETDVYSDTEKTITQTYKTGNDIYLQKERRFNAGINLGIAVWYKRFCFDVTYNMGFLPYRTAPVQPAGMSDYDFSHLDSDALSSLDWKVDPANDKSINYNVQFKLGIAF